MYSLKKCHFLAKKREKNDGIKDHYIDPSSVLQMRDRTETRLCNYPGLRNESALFGGPFKKRGGEESKM
jgi:hypothetical protein